MLRNSYYICVEKIWEIKSLFTISSQQFYNFTPEFSSSYLFYTCLPNVWISIQFHHEKYQFSAGAWNNLFPEILQRNHFSFPWYDALSFFTTRETKSESSNRYLEIRAISYSRVREKKRARGKCVELKKRETWVRKVCYKTAIHGKNITV